ncbi:recombinase family protein, partial [Paraburkholderia sediminicola]|uniref:recombinase family protein n=1 Tax=Paraburkholderia sediminicola TaxID=458836 RepID=UPI0038BA2276
MTAEVALGHVGIILGLEVSRLARNNSDWYRLLDLCTMTDTLIGDADGVYNPALFNDRLLLGLKGTMSEAELHTLRVRLDGGIRNKAARGEPRRGLPTGMVWGDVGNWGSGISGCLRGKQRVHGSRFAQVQKFFRGRFSMMLVLGIFYSAGPKVFRPSVTLRWATDHRSA